MLLQPRRYTFKTRQKNRHVKTFALKTLSFGTSGLRVLQPLRLTSKQIFRLYIFLKKTSRKSDHTKRSFWFNTFPHLPLTRKPKGSRMGKGAGKLHIWFTNVQAGTIIVEFTNLRSGRSKYFWRQLGFKFAVPIMFIQNKSRTVKLRKSRRSNVFLEPFYRN